MALPSPIPDNPTKWEGWRNYNSANPYERLCLSFDSNPSDHQIEDHCRQLLVWWQKKLPLKNQPSNPLAQMLRAGLDEAPRCIVEARIELLDSKSRALIDSNLRAQMKENALVEFKKFFSFAVADGFLGKEDEVNLYRLGAASGLEMEEMKALLDTELVKRGAQRKVDAPAPPPPATTAVAAASGHAQNPAEEFKRMLRLSGLDSDLTDDQRDALCNMGENLGLTGGEAEDLIDAYIDEMEGVAPSRPLPPARALTPPKKETCSRKVATQIPGRQDTAFFPPLNRAQEKVKYPNFTNSIGMEMLLVPSGVFSMGSAAPDAAPIESPVSQVTQSCFYIARFPVTNRQYEKFDPSHAAKRASWAKDDHPVIYVSSNDAMNFCKWISSREHKKYRLPTEAEWEYAAKGSDGRAYPWGEKLDRGDLANFADRRTNFLWKDHRIDDGYAETSPVGAYPHGASPFGMEEMAGNVWEWCLDFLEQYKNRPRTNPRGPSSGTKRIYRGGSWKSRAGSLRASTRGFNLPEYSSNDVGFRAVCECV